MAEQSGQGRNSCFVCAESPKYFVELDGDYYPIFCAEPTRDIPESGWYGTINGLDGDCCVEVWIVLGEEEGLD